MRVWMCPRHRIVNNGTTIAAQTATVAAIKVAPACPNDGWVLHRGQTKLGRDKKRYLPQPVRRPCTRTWAPTQTRGGAGRRVRRGA